MLLNRTMVKRLRTELNSVLKDNEDMSQDS